MRGSWVGGVQAFRRGVSLRRPVSRLTVVSLRVFDACPRRFQLVGSACADGWSCDRTHGGGGSSTDAGLRLRVLAPSFNYQLPLKGPRARPEGQCVVLVGRVSWRAARLRRSERSEGRAQVPGRRRSAAAGAVGTIKSSASAETALGPAPRVWRRGVLPYNMVASEVGPACTAVRSTSLVCRLVHVTVLG